MDKGLGFWDIEIEMETVLMPWFARRRTRTS